VHTIQQQQQQTVAREVRAALQSQVRDSVPINSQVPPSLPSPSFPLSAESIMPAAVRVAPPSTYNGLRQVNVETWLFEVFQYLTLCGVKEDEQRIALASSYLKEAALQWWVGLCRDPNSVPHTWDAFGVALRSRFQPVAASRTARAQLRALSQGSMNVADYNNKFYSLVQLIPDMSDADQVELFISGLRPRISKEVDLREPANLQAAMTAAQKIELLLDTHRSHYGNSSYTTRPSSSSSFFSPSHSSSSSSTSSGSSPMELGHVYAKESEQQQEKTKTESVDWDVEYQRFIEQGDEYEPSSTDRKEVEEVDDEREAENSVEQLQAMQRKFNRAMSMPREEFKRCMEQRLCLRCKKPGHIARNCSLPPRHPSKSVRNFH